MRSTECLLVLLLLWTYMYRGQTKPGSRDNLLLFSYCSPRGILGAHNHRVSHAFEKPLVYIHTAATHTGFEPGTAWSHTLPNTDTGHRSIDRQGEGGRVEYRVSVPRISCKYENNILIGVKSTSIMSMYLQFHHPPS